MGTRARVNVLDGNHMLVSIYRQFDGYLTGLGAELVEFLNPLELVSGLTPGGSQNQANGMGDLAAQLVTHLKSGQVGNVYLRDITLLSHGEEFAYTIYEKNNKIHIVVQEGEMTFFGAPGNDQNEMDYIFDGTVEDFKEFISKNQDD